jgi:hypothetical protein
LDVVRAEDLYEGARPTDIDAFVELIIAYFKSQDQIDDLMLAILDRTNASKVLKADEVKHTGGEKKDEPQDEAKDETPGIGQEETRERIQAPVEAEGGPGYEGNRPEEDEARRKWQEDQEGHDPAGNPDEKEPHPEA